MYLMIAAISGFTCTVLTITFLLILLLYNYFVYRKWDD